MQTDAHGDAGSLIKITRTESEISDSCVLAERMGSVLPIFEDLFDGVAPAQQRVRERRRPADISANTFALVSVSSS